MNDNNDELDQAVKRNDLSAADKALKSGASADYIHKREDSWEREEIPVLYTACEKENKEIIELLLANGADPNVQYRLHEVIYWETRPCLFAALSSFEIVDLLLKNGADPNIPRAYGEDCYNPTTAIAEAKRQGNRKVIALLKQYGARE